MRSARCGNGRPARRDAPEVSRGCDAGRTWSPRTLLGAPHRLGFAIGGLSMSVIAVWWLVVLTASGLGVGMAWVVSPTLAHGVSFTLGFMPAFIAGFLFTAGPRWLALPAVDARRLLAPLLQFAAGWLAVLAGVHASRVLVALGLAMAAVSWARLSLRFAALQQASRVADLLHARWLLAACAMGVVAMLLACHAVLQGDAPQLHAAVQLGLWGFVAPVFVVVSHRMFPQLAASAPPWLGTWSCGAQLLALLGCLALAGVAPARWLPPWASVPPLAMAAFALGQVVHRWGKLRGPAAEAGRLSTMLRGGFAWLAVALGLQALSVTLQAAGRDGLGAAPLHALTMGYLGCTLLAMATRVVAARSGRTLAIDLAGWRLYRLLQLGVLLRLAAALGGGSGAVLWLAAAAWAGVTTAWTWRYVGWLGRPRVDGRPG